MRKLILALFIILSCASLANSGGIISFPGGGVAGLTCQLYYTNPNFTSADQGDGIGRYSAQDYSGFVYNPTANVTVCAVDVWIYGVQENTGISSYEYYIVWFEFEDTGDTVTSFIANGQSDMFLGSAVKTANGGYLNVPFSTPFTLDSSKLYAITGYYDTDKDGVVDEDITEDLDDYWRFGYDNEAGDSAFEGRTQWAWDASIPFEEAAAPDLGDAPGIRIYTMQP